jgi:hypothetical protein
MSDRNATHVDDAAVVVAVSERINRVVQDAL